MATEKDSVPPSTEVSPLDLHLSACAIEGHQDDPTEGAERLRRETERAQANISSNIVRLAVGQLLSGRYRIERELGEGGMGVVYLAADEQVPGERFAIKVLKRPEALALLSEEVRKTRKLSHPNIVDVHSVNVDGEKLYVLMEYLEGNSLDKLLDEEFGRGMSFSHAWPIIEDVGEALANAHEHNVIHSDLKPANVFLTTSGRTKLLDFGIARVWRGPLLQAQSGPRALTPAYASCEMLEGKQADRRDDIYSFACVIYEMLSGDRPFGDLTALEAREAGRKVPPLEGLTQGQNVELARALAFDREARTGKVETVLARLAAAHRPRIRPAALLGAVIVAVVAAAGLTYLTLDRLGTSRHSVVVQSAAPLAQETGTRGVPAAFSPPPHSIAVLPFTNMSGDAGQEYFSDGLTEELLNSLSRINELQVAARTSSFYFKGKDVDLPTIAHKLNVASVLEGSVRRSGNKIRVTAQLNNAITGFHLWSQTYDRDLSDVLQLQSDVANAVATALKVTLLGDVAAKIELGGTRNPAAFDAFLRATRLYNTQALEAAIAGYTEAIRLDPDYALAYADRSMAMGVFITQSAKGPALRDYFDKAWSDARRAVALAPDLAEGHLALAGLLQNSLQFAGATREYDRAIALAPGNARVLRNYGWFAVNMGQTEAGLTAAHRAVVLDPVNYLTHWSLGVSLLFARRYAEAIASFTNAKALPQNDPTIDAWIGVSHYLTGDFASAQKVCASANSFSLLICMAITNNKLGRRTDAEAMLAKLRALRGDNFAVVYAMIYAQWGDHVQALEWLDTGVRLHDPWLQWLKVFQLFDPLRQEPRFQAIERALKFPD